jgi:hypothetical protein
MSTPLSDNRIESRYRIMPRMSDLAAMPDAERVNRPLRSTFHDIPHREFYGPF